MIVVSALIVTLITVIIIQYLLILRMRKSKDVLSSNDTYAESSMNVDVPTTPNEAYRLHKITRPSEELGHL